MRTPSPAVAIPALILAAALALAAPARAAEPFSHDAWERVLRERVDARGLVDYRGLAADRADLDRYIASLRAASPASSPELFPTRDHELAYYLNAYNAWVFWGVLDLGPDTSSVWGLFGTGLSFFSGMDIELGGRETDLKALEDEVIRAEYRDPRIHAALNCASVSCPRLPREAFTGPELDAQLDAAIRAFVTDPQHLAVDRGARKVRMSKIFDWYAGDFLAYVREKAAREKGTRDPNVLDYVNLYRGEAGRIPRDYAIEYLEYDKGLNSQ